MRTAAELTRAFASFSVVVVSGLVLGTAACGGGKDADTTPTQPAPPEVQPLDIVHEYDGAAMDGIYFEPQALERPGMPPIKAKRMPSLAQARRKAGGKRAKPDDVHVYVTLLWNDAMTKEAAGTEEGRTKAAQGYGEGRTLLQGLYDRAGDDGAPEVLVRRLAVAEATLGNQAGAIERYQELIERFPESEQAGEDRAWLAYYLLRGNELQQAAALLEGVDAEAEDTTAETAYVLAWINFRQRNAEVARKSIAAAARKWQGAVGRQAMLNDVQLIMARMGGDIDEARDALQSALPADKPVILTLQMYKLHEAMLFAGRYREAADALENLIENAVPSDRVTFRYNQADYEFRLNNPLKGAERIAQAYKACAEWDQCPDQTKNVIAERVQLLARVYHSTFAATLDDKYAQAAKVLYNLYLEVPNRQNTEEIKGNLKNLEEHIAAADSANGRHSKDVMEIYIQARGEQAKACYENVLGANPGLEGVVKVTVDVQETGTVSGVTTEPAAGKEKLAAVAACLTEDVRGWGFPGRTVPGLTRLVYPYTFKPAATAAAPAAAPTEQ